jgi:carboxymethylenebutenolidase
MGAKVNFPVDAGEPVTGYFALPADGAGPGVVVLQDWWTLVGHSGSVVDRLAAEGFAALAPDLPQQVPGNEPDDARRAQLSRAMEPAAQDVAAAARYLSGLSGGTAPVGILGFGMGGSLALWTAATRSEVVAAAAFYPSLPWEGMDPEWPGFAGKGAVVHRAEEDPSSSAAGIGAAVKAIEAAGSEVAVTVYDYPGTRHAFFNDDRPETYDLDASSVAWARTIELFRTRLA